MGEPLYHFRPDRIDDDAARRAYRRLHDAIRSADDDGPECFLAHATTNYDTALETAIEQDNRFRVVDGFSRRPGGGSEKYTLDAFAAATDSNRAVPVLHLHGAVGWYLNPDDTVERDPADRPYDDRRTPALLLPDDKKSPATFNAAAFQTWKQFDQLLTQATHVLFLGHSLHDQHIVQAVGRSDVRVAAVIYTEPDEAGNYPEPDETEVERCRDLLPEIVALPGKFGQNREWDDLDIDQLTRWLRASDPSSTPASSASI